MATIPPHRTRTKPGYPLMVEFSYSEGPRILEDGTNLDRDIVATHPTIQRRSIADPVSDGSLGDPGYQPGQKNLDGSDL